MRALLSVRALPGRQFHGFKRRLRAIARTDTRARAADELMTTPGAGVIVALTLACAIDDRFKLSKAVGAYFGLTPTRYIRETRPDRDRRLNIEVVANHLLTRRPKRRPFASRQAAGYDTDSEQAIR